MLEAAALGFACAGMGAGLVYWLLSRRLASAQSTLTGATDELRRATEDIRGEGWK